MTLSILFTSAYFLLSMGAAIGVIVAGAVGLHFEKRFGKMAGTLLPALLLGAIGLAALFSGRNVSYYGFASILAADAASAGESYWVLRLATALAVGVSGVIIASRLFSRVGTAPVDPTLFYAFLAYFISTYIVSGFFGTEPTLTHSALYPIVVVTAIFLVSGREPDVLARYSRNAFLVFIVLSLVLLVLYPQLVRQDGYKGVLPGIDFRFWGLASHANNMGPVSLFFLLLLRLLPYRSRWATAVAAVLAVVAMLLAQSKTTWIAAACVALAFVIRAAYRILTTKDRPGEGNPAKVLTGGAVVVMIAVLLTVLVSNVSSISVMSAWFPMDESGGFLTGRDRIWDITLRHWRDNPLFGYGPELWSFEFSRKWGYLGIASNAHNQIIDVLGASGVFGLVFFLGYFFLLLRYALVLAPSTRGVSIAFVVFLTVRGVSEVPLKLANITTTDFVMHAIALGVFMELANRRKRQKLAEASAGGVMSS